MSDDPIPAVSEADARGDVHRLFEDICQVLGVPVVNLIFRHLATLPGCLGWSWGVLRPLYASGQVADAADRLGTSLLDSYNRSNAMNLVALTDWLRSGAASGQDAARDSLRDALTPSPPTSIAKMVPIARLLRAALPTAPNDVP